MDKYKKREKKYFDLIIIFVHIFVKKF